MARKCGGADEDSRHSSGVLAAEVPRHMRKRGKTNSDCLAEGSQRDIAAHTPQRPRTLHMWGGSLGASPCIRKRAEEGSRVRKRGIASKGRLHGPLNGLDRATSRASGELHR